MTYDLIIVGAGPRIGRLFCPDGPSGRTCGPMMAGMVGALMGRRLCERERRA